MQICPVCFWEDAPGEAYYNGSNEVPLVHGQRHFLETGACEDHFKDGVRPPLPGEARPDDWHSFDDLCSRLTDLIEKEFRSVLRDGGVTLHQMDVLDDWGGEEQLKKAALEDPEETWQEIPHEKLSHFHQSLAFLDHSGFRFYLPAFMRHALVTAHPDIESAEISGVLWSLYKGPDTGYRKETFDLLTLGQKHCVGAFMHLFATMGCGGGCDTSDARQGLRKGWSAFVPHFVKLSTPVAPLY